MWLIRPQRSLEAAGRNPTAEIRDERLLLTGEVDSSENRDAALDVAGAAVAPLGLVVDVNADVVPLFPQPAFPDVTEVERGDDASAENMRREVREDALTTDPPIFVRARGGVITLPGAEVSRCWGRRRTPARPQARRARPRGAGAGRRHRLGRSARPQRGPDRLAAALALGDRRRRVAPPRSRLGGGRRTAENLSLWRPSDESKGTSGK
jgi:hypothetical protein